MGMRKIRHNPLLCFVLLLSLAFLSVPLDRSLADGSPITITRPDFPIVDRTWDNVTLRYENSFHDSLDLQREIERFHELAVDLIDVEVIGQSYLGKNITALRITNERATVQKAKTLVVAHHHGREQITVETALRFITYLLNSYDREDAVTDYVNTQEIYVIPTVNPDALDIVVNDRDFWLRKNVRPYDDDGDGLLDEDSREDVDGDGTITGFDVYTRSSPSADPVYEYTYFEGVDNDGDGQVNEDTVGYTDLNRNYDSYWRNGSGWSSDTRSQVYPGPSPFSEPETRAFRDFAVDHGFAMAYSLHSGINATYFPTDPSGGWTEAGLYWQMVQDYAGRLPPSYTEMYLNPATEQRQLASVLAGGWDTWMYYERGTQVPMTFELFRNASSVAAGTEIPIVDNSTHLILEWKQIYGFFNPEARFIDKLWNTVRPAFDYLLEMTPRLSVDATLISGGPNEGDELVISFDCENLSPRLETIEPLNVITEEGEAIQVGPPIPAGEQRGYQVALTLPFDLTAESYDIKIGNNYTGYSSFIISTEKEILPTDLNRDGAVDILDIGLVVLAFNSEPGDANWNQIADLDKNEWINIVDVAMVAKDYARLVQRLDAR